MAGGILPEGDLTRINLAAPLEDGQKVYIPSREEAEMMPEMEKTPINRRIRPMVFPMGG